MKIIQPGKFHLLADAPMCAGAQIWGGSWTEPSEYGPLPLVRIFPYQGTVAVPRKAKAVSLKLKAKAVIGEAPDYCQIDATLAALDPSQQNHSVHVEEWGGPKGRRRLSYSAVTVPLAEDGGFALSIRRGIWGKGEVSLAIMLDGYWQ